MIIYIIKRVLLMIPTFAVISMIIFLVLNLAPGDPSAQAAADGTETVSQDAQESYRIFKEQFNLDKPILFNTRYNLTTEDIEKEVQVLADSRRPICPDEELQRELDEKAAEEEEFGGLAAETPPAAGGDEPGLDQLEIAEEVDENCIPVADRPRSGRIIDAQENLQNWGDYAVLHLIDVAENSERVDMRVIALNQVSTNARSLRLERSNPDPSPKIREKNRAITRENNEFRNWRVSYDAEGEAVDEKLQENWMPWLEENRDRFEYGAADKIGIFFLDTRFAKYWDNLLHLDLGLSTVDRQPVLDTLLEKLPRTMVLSFFAIFFAYLISVPLGIWSAYNQNTKRDQFVTVLLFVFYSLPSFFTAVLLIQFFAIDQPFSFFPVGGFISTNADNLPVLNQISSLAWHIFLPIICLTYGSLAALSRYARTGILDVIRADYIRTARAKGLSESMVILKHAVRNGMIPILTLLGTLLPALVSGSLVIEYIFNIPGVGLYLFDSIFMLDYNAIMGCLLISTAMTLVGLLISDISYAIVDPRITFE